MLTFTKHLFSITDDCIFEAVKKAKWQISLVKIH